MCALYMQVTAVSTRWHQVFRAFDLLPLPYPLTSKKLNFMGHPDGSWGVQTPGPTQPFIPPEWVNQVHVCSAEVKGL